MEEEEEEAVSRSSFPAALRKGALTSLAITRSVTGAVLSGICSLSSCARLRPWSLADAAVPGVLAEVAGSVLSG